GLRQRLLRARGLSHRVRPAQRRGLRAGAEQGLHLRPDLPRRELQHHPPPGRVLDGGAGDRVRRPDRDRARLRGLPQVPVPRGAARARRRHGVHRPAGAAGCDHAPGGLRQRAVRAPDLQRGGGPAAEVGEEVRVPGRMGPGPADRTRALADRGTRRPPGGGDRLPRAHQGLLHAPQRRRQDRRRDGRAGAGHRRDHRRLAARGTAGRARPAHGPVRPRPRALPVVPRLPPLRHRPAQRLRPRLRAAGGLHLRPVQHPRRHPLPARARPRRVLGMTVVASELILLFALLFVALAIAGATAFVIFWPLTLVHIRDRHPAIKAELGEGAFLRPAALWWLLRGGYRAFPDRSLSGLATPARIALSVILLGLALAGILWLWSVAP